MVFAVLDGDVAERRDVRVQTVAQRLAALADAAPQPGAGEGVGGRREGDDSQQREDHLQHRGDVNNHFDFLSKYAVSASVINVQAGADFNTQEVEQTLEYVRAV